MVDFALLHRPVLATAKSGAFGARSTSGRITLTALPEGHVLQVLASAGRADVEQALAQLGDGGVQAIRPYGPGQWFLVGDAAFSSAEIFAMAAQLNGAGSIADQSHGRVRIGIAGSAVETVLAKGTAVDLALSQYPVGRSAMTLIGHISALITRTGPDSFELMVLRGFAESLWDELIEMSLECGVDAKTAN
ncbi:sarcosine oxidase subunit gamma family protein [Pararhizobium sp. O133]|uniref:sarcosine oxidase subunit gamma family protein n=1 Tax=Pararhizobium sp. O133 TaxID=3449278 RepID=UPI003F688B3C